MGICKEHLKALGDPRDRGRSVCRPSNSNTTAPEINLERVYPDLPGRSRPSVATTIPQVPEVGMLEPDGTLRLLRQRESPEEVWHKEM